MKKLISLAVIVCAALFILTSCGPDKKAIQAKAHYFVNESATATMNGDYDRLESLSLEEQKYLNGLSEEEQKIYTEEVLNYALSKIN